jgi:hypothetical protein
VRAVVLSRGILKILPLLMVIVPRSALSDANLVHVSRPADSTVRALMDELDPDDGGDCLSLGALDIVFRTDNYGPPSVGVILTDPRGRRIGFDLLTKLAVQAVERQKVEAYAQIASGIFLQLFGRNPRIASTPASPDQLPRAIVPQPLHDASKGWFFIMNEGQGYFAATANAKGSCSLRIFNSGTGQFLNKTYRRGDYREAFRDILDNARPLQVTRQPNLERDCRPRLPTDVLEELQRQSQIFGH